MYDAVAVLRIHLLGDPRGFHADAPLPPPHPTKLLALWTYLLLRRDQAVPRDRVAFTLWPDLPEAEARANLRRHMHLLRRYLPSAPAGHPWLISDRHTVQWNPEAEAWLDVLAFETAALSLEDARSESLSEDLAQRLQEAADLYTGDLAESLYEDWVWAERERLGRRYVQVLDRLIEAHAASGDLPLALATGQRLLAYDPLREETHRLVMSLQYLAGDRAAALRQFEVCRRLLAEELEVEPMPETLTLHQAILLAEPPAQILRLLQRPALLSLARHGELALRPPEPTPNNLPVQLTSFVGREREIAQVKELLLRNRLLTLTGSGGSGKTRLALEVAASLLGEFPDGTWWVELAPVADPALVPQAAATAASAREEPKRPLAQTLENQLARQKTLLVLDNCEHLVGACATLVEGLLRACPHLRVLVTSRELLNLAGEMTWRVRSLSLPERSEKTPLERLAEYEAVRLFVERAVLSQPAFAMTAENAPAILQICRRLDGIPLAIELAAARVRVLSPDQIQARLDDAFRLLTVGPRTHTPRHRTLRAAVDWSYDLLGRKEQLLFNRLSAFAGGFGLEAAEAVCGDPVPAEAPQDGLGSEEVLDFLSQLVEKSLLLAEQEDAGSVRYRMLDTLRQYGRARLASSGEVETIRRRLAAHCMALVEAVETALVGPEQAALDKLEREHDNLRAALQWSVEAQEPGLGLRLAGAAWRFWAVRGYFSEGREWLLELLALPEASGKTAARAKALYGAGALSYYHGDYAPAGALFEESLAVHRSLGDREGIASSLNSLGIVAREQGDAAAARQLLEKSLAIRRELGGKLGIATSLLNLGLIVEDQANYPAARSLYEESLALFRQLDDKTGAANSLLNLANVLREQGEFAEARSLLQENLAIRRELGHKLGFAYSLESLAALAAARAQWKRAWRLAGAAAALREELKAPLPPAERTRLEAYLRSAQQALGRATAARARAQGEVMSLKQALDYALQLDD